MKTILVASKNPVKINAALKGFQKVFPGSKFKVKGISINSDVKDQPMSDEETLRGARNRVNKAIKKYTEYDYFVGIEGGAEEIEKELTTFAWVVIRSGKKIGKGKTATFLLPQKATKLIRKGKELGDAMDQIFNKKNIKHKSGAIGLLTDNLITRTQLYTPTVIIALIPFYKEKLYY